MSRCSLHPRWPLMTLFPVFWRRRSRCRKTGKTMVFGGGAFVAENVRIHGANRWHWSAEVIPDHIDLVNWMGGIPWCAPAWCPAGPFCRSDPEQTAILALSGASTKRSSALFVLRMGCDTKRKAPARAPRWRFALSVPFRSQRWTRRKPFGASSAIGWQGHDQGPERRYRGAHVVRTYLWGAFIGSYNQPVASAAPRAAANRQIGKRRGTAQHALRYWQTICVACSQGL